MRIISSVAILLLGTACAVSAQQKIVVTGGADMVSSYVWRGTYNAGASFQPLLKGELGGVVLSGWGSTDFIGDNKKEVDLSLSYSLGGFTLGAIDYWWEGEGTFGYFDYNNRATAHRWEGNLLYQLPIEKFPLTVAWNTMFAGSDYDIDGTRAYSTYIELCYPFSVGDVDMTAAVGATPWYSPSILPSENRGFSICNLAIGATKEVSLSDRFSLPLFARLIFNPAIGDVHFVFGLSLYFKSE